MNSEEYEKIRNETLLFFLEKLIDKDYKLKDDKTKENKPKGNFRSLHDLSCQFGKPGFTKEMKQIAGGSQSGLKKFLLKYPFIFTVDGDNVSLTEHANENNKNSKRDFSKEAVEYFRKKLEQYGNAEVPIGSFLGHRSQATSEIRHISGQNATEFKEFLMKHNEIFHVKDDYVVLRSVLDQVDENGVNVKIKRFVEEPPIDPYIMQQFVSILEETTIELTKPADEEDREKYLTECANNSVLLDVLFEKVKAKCQGQLWEKLVGTEQDLFTILKMNSKSFHVNSNMVSLTEDRINHLKRNCQSPNSTINNFINPTNLNGSQPKLTASNSFENSINQINSNNNNNNNNTSLLSQLQQSPPTSLCSSTSSSTNSTSIRIVNHDNGNIVNTLSQRMRSQITKTLTENLYKQPNNFMNYNYNWRKISQVPQLFQTTLLNQISIITSLDDGEKLVNHILSNQLTVTIDLEGINLNSNGQITLLQMSIFEDDKFPKLSCVNKKGLNYNIPKIYIFDILYNSQLLEKPLKELLESTRIIKVFHDCRNASACLYNQFKIELKNVFDIQVAHAVLDQQNQLKPVYKPRFMSMNALCEKYTSGSIQYENLINKKSIKRNFKKDNQYWSIRPLTEEMLFYSSIDIFIILNDIFSIMKDNIKIEYYPLMQQLNEEAILTKIRPDDVKTKKKFRKTEMEVTDLKNKLFNRDSTRIVLSNREIRLLRYIPLTEEIKSKIDSSQKVAKKLERFQQRKQNGQSKDNLYETQSNSDEEDEDDDDIDENNESNLSSYNSNDNSHETSFSSKFCDKFNEEIKIEDDEINIKEEIKLNDELNSICSCNCHVKQNDLLKLSENKSSKCLNYLHTNNHLFNPTELDCYLNNFVNKNKTDSTFLSTEKIDEKNNNLIDNELNEEEFNGHTNGYTNGHHHTENGLTNGESFHVNNGKRDFSTQTLSTGDIVITKVFFSEGISN